MAAPTRQLAGGPIHPPAPEDVEVEVADRVEGVGADVEDQPVPAAGDSLAPGHILGGGEHLAQELAVLGTQRASIADVFPRHHQNVHRRYGSDVPEGIDVGGRRHLDRGQLTAHDAAEQAVSHACEVTALMCQHSSMLVANRLRSWEPEGVRG